MLHHPAHAPCPCGRTPARGPALAYAACCGRWLESDAAAPDAEQLMRSRYSAFVLARADYLLATWHPRHRPSTIDFEVGTQWRGLDIRAYQQIDATHAEVEFIARQKPRNAPALRQHERSRFVLEQGRWWYVDGDVL